MKKFVLEKVIRNWWSFIPRTIIRFLRSLSLFEFEFLCEGNGENWVSMYFSLISRFWWFDSIIGKIYEKLLLDKSKLKNFKSCLISFWYGVFDILYIFVFHCFAVNVTRCLGQVLQFIVCESFRFMVVFRVCLDIVLVW